MRGAVAALFISLPAVAWAQRGIEGPLSRFSRFVDEGRWEGRLETAVVDYEGPGGVTVSLVAVMHYGDRAYYEKLQEVLDAYEVLLYEGWREAEDSAGAGGPPPEHREGKPAAPSLGDKLVGLMTKAAGICGHRLMRDVLGLEEQWGRIDYTRAHFVNADMDLDTFRRRVREEGEARKEITAFLYCLALYAMEATRRLLHDGPATRDVLQFMKEFSRGEGRRLLKQLVARESERFPTAFLDVLEVTLDERNRIALAELRRQIRWGRRRIGIFYGAAHMPGLEARLVGELGLRKVSHRWLTAWDARKARPR